MATEYAKIVTGNTQREKAHPKQKKNRAGGYTFVASDWIRLNRFLIMGVPGNTYYATQRTLVKENAAVVIKCIEADGIRTVKEIRDVAASGRAIKMDSVLFALALAMKHGDKPTRTAAYNTAANTARIFTFLTQLHVYRKDLGLGTGDGWKRSVQNWYLRKSITDLAYQMLKYKNRNGLSHQDFLRFAHVVPDTEDRDALFAWAVGKATPADYERLDSRIIASETLHNTVNPDTVDQLVPSSAIYIKDWRLTREMIPNELLSSPDIWNALLIDMPMAAMVRNLGKMSSVGALTRFSDTATQVIEKLNNAEKVHYSRIHPVNFLVASKTYESGHGVKGSLTWTPVPQVVDALQDAFMTRMVNRETTLKRVFIGLDVSGSMASYRISDAIPFTAKEMGAAIALALLNYAPQSVLMGFHNDMVNLGITAKTALNDAIDKSAKQPFGPTDCALPMLYALGHSPGEMLHAHTGRRTYKKTHREVMPVDTFVILTDNETWFGDIHPHVALAQYRKETGIQAKLIVLSMLPNRATIVDDSDPLCLDIVGMDANVVSLIDDFIADDTFTEETWLY